MDMKSFKSVETEKPSITDKNKIDVERWIDNDNKEDKVSTDKYSVEEWMSESKEVSDIIRIECRNEKYEGDNHPKTGVPYERKVVDLGDRKVEGVFPVFNSDFDAYLPKELFKESNYKQFKECNMQLAIALRENPSLCEKFTDEQIEEIMDGETPSGKVWHHNEELGKMQLVDFKTHDETKHTGGKFLWGGGSECRKE